MLDRLVLHCADMVRSERDRERKKETKRDSLVEVDVVKVAGGAALVDPVGVVLEPNLPSHNKPTSQTFMNISSVTSKELQSDYFA